MFEMWRILNGEALALGLDLDIGATLTPFEDTFHGNPLYGYYDEVKEKKRQAVNECIRKSGAFDGVIDFDDVTRDPVNPKHILPAYDSGDHLHPQDTGYKAMADSIDLSLLKPIRWPRVRRPELIAILVVRVVGRRPSLDHPTWKSHDL